MNVRDKSKQGIISKINLTGMLLKSISSVTRGRGSRGRRANGIGVTEEVACSLLGPDAQGIVTESTEMEDTNYYLKK